MIELLSPAGDLERLKIAALYGADAIYIGGKSFGLRANATNFDIDEIKEAASFLHNLNKKLYVTVNIVFHNEDLDGLPGYLKELEKAKVDAVIVSDLYVVDIIKKNNINLEIHISTQDSTLNSRKARFYINKGASRIVLAREATKEDIKRIKEETGVELEAFIQGAMCTSFSGRCVLSNYVTNRDSNRGGCAQVCRFMFDAGFDKPFEIASKDLNMTSNIKEMIEAGVNSFKIEGRMRSIYYLGTVLHTYKNIFNKIESNTLDKEYIEYATKVINRVANRDSVSQFFNGIPKGEGQYYNKGRQEVSNQDFLGLIRSYDDGYLTLEVRNNFKLGEKVLIFGPDMEDQKLTIEEIIDEDGNTKEVCNHPKEIVKIKCSFEVKENYMMHKEVDL